MISSVGYDTFIVYHDTDTNAKYCYLILLVNTKCRSEHLSCSQKHDLVYETHTNSNTVPLKSQDPEIFEVEHAQSTGNCSAKQEKSFYVISGSMCINIDVSVTCDTDALQMYQ